MGPPAEMAQTQSAVCAVPKRSRQADIYALLSIETAAMICLGLRLYSRHLTLTRYEGTDYIMMLVAV